MRTKDYWCYSCDRCKTLIRPEDPTKPGSSFKEMHKAGKLIVHKNRKGRIMHYCSSDCAKKHFKPGEGQPSQPDIQGDYHVK